MARASHGSVLEDLGSAIANGDHSPGSVLTLGGLEEQYRASRTVIREAVKVLEAMNMLALRRRVGITVLPSTVWSSLDARLIRWRLEGSTRAQQIVALTELRLAIEPIAAGLAAARASDVQRQQFADLAAILQKLGDANLGDSQEYLDADIAFHNLLLDASGNLMLSAIKEPIAQVLAGRNELGFTPATPHQDALHNHIEAAAAILRGDSDAAERHARGYVSTVLGEVKTLP